jgi:tRNA(fMet)-specific endonuclease VapC
VETLNLLLDTSVLIQSVRAEDKSKTLLGSLAGTRGAAISAITLMELEFGTLSEAHRAFRDRIVHDYPVLPFDARAAEIAGDIYRQLRAEGRRLDMPDLMIAAVAVAHGLPLATVNVRHFDRVPQLRLYQER